VNGLGATPRPVQTPRPPVWIAGSSPAAIRRAATFGDGWLPQGPSDAEMVAKLQAQREEHGRADRPMMIGDITPFLYVGTAKWDLPDGTLSGAPGDIAEEILADTAEGVNQLQVRFLSRSCEEQCDQMAAFAQEVAPILTSI
jgi:alkanesulfonate monooxygenase SsuD/methylene tetrahydromethanopterin reductase-like flavin-dependent oxidoreductase (luciferase family)